MTTPEIAAVSPVGPEGSAILRAYFTDAASRGYRRPATEAEVERAQRVEPSDDLVPPTGLFLLAPGGESIQGCAGPRSTRASGLTGGSRRPSISGPDRPRPRTRVVR